MAVALWLAGRGFGWLGDDGVPKRDEASAPATAAPNLPPDAASPAAPAAVPPQAGEQGTTEPEVQPVPESTEPPQPGAAGVGAPSVDTPAAPTGETAGIDLDRFDSLLSLVDLRLAQDAPSQALAVLGDLQRLGPSAEQRSALATRRSRAVAALDALVVRIAGALAAGEVSGAAAIAGELLAAGDDAAAALSGLPGPAWRLAAQAAPWRQPEPLVKGRSVRVRLGGIARVGTIADCRSDRATVRLAHGQGVTFPTVPLWQIEPLEPTADEAAALGWACLAAGEVVVGRCWAHVARLRGGGPAAAALEAAFAERE